ncbi:putative ribonuclease H-like domain-containing protein [Tanacetum coccineum]
MSFCLATKPIIRYIRPFGCHVTILDTLSVLGKFDGKSDEGFLVGYSLNSKAYRVYNLVTKRVEVNLHVNFLEDKPNVKGVGYRWMFDIDYLTDSMNYIPVSLENQANPHAGTSEVTNNAGTSQTPNSNASEEKDEDIELIVVPSAVKITEEKVESRTSSTNSKKEEILTEPQQEKKVSSTDTLEDNPKIQAFRRELEEIALKHLGTVPENNSTSTPSVNTGNQTVNTGRLDPDDSPMPELEIFHKSETGIFDEASYDEEGVITDFNSLPTEIEVSPTPTLRIHNIHPKSQILGGLNVSSWGRGGGGGVEPKMIADSLQMTAVQAMQETLLQFKLQQVGSCRSTAWNEVYVSQPLAFVNPDHPKKVYKVVKALYGLHQAPRAWYATLSTFLEKHGYKRGTIDKTLFIKRDKKDIMLMSSMGELTFFLGLQVKQNKAGIFISQDKYIVEILKKFDLVNVKAAITPMETKVAMTKDEEAIDVDVHLYRSMIGSLMYLTASRPDIIIFKYLKGKPNLGLWYPRESPFDLEAFSDSDYGGSNLDRKSITGGCQFLGQRLISWQCKKQTIVSTSTTKAEYESNIDNESTICIVKETQYHSKTKHIEIRHHFIRDCYEKKLISMEKIHTDLNVADLLTKSFDGPRFNYLVVSIGYTITEASIRDKLQLADASGIAMLPNDELFEGMGQIRYPTDGTFTFWKSFFTPQWRYLVHHLLHCISSKSGGWDQFSSNIATALICLSTGRVYNFSKLIFDGMVANLKSKTKFLMYPRFLQLILDIQTENKHPYLAVTLTKKIFGNMKRGFRGAPRPLLPAMLLVATTNPNAGQEHHAVAQSQPSSSTLPAPSTSSPPVQSPPPIPTPTPIPETKPEPIGHTFEEPSPTQQHFSPPQEQAQGQMTMDDLLQVVPQLMSRIDSLETYLKQTKLTMGSVIVKLVKKVKKLEGILKRRNVVLSDSEEEELEAQGRKSQDDPLVSLVQGLVTPSKPTINASGEEQVEDISPTTLEEAKTLSKVASQKPKSIDKGRRYKRRNESKGKKVATSLDFQEEVNTGSIKVSIVSEQVSTGSTKRSIPSPDKGQREGKAPMIIEEAPKKSKEQILQEEASLAEAIRLDTLQKEEEAKQHYTDEDWDLIRAKIEANTELSKNMLGSDLQGEDFVKKMVDLVESFEPINFEATKDSLKRFGEELQTKTSKRLKNDEAKDDEPTKKSGKRRKQMARKGLHIDLDKDDSEDSDEVSEQDDSVSGTKIPVNPVPVAMKSPSIATYKIIKQGEKGVYQIIREDGTDIVYINFGAMLKDISRDDLTELYRIVMNRYGMDGPEDELEKVLWEYLKNMFEEPLSTDPIWSVLGQQRIISWRYYDTCRVHCLNLESMDIYMLIERKYPLSAEICKTMLE